MNTKIESQHLENETGDYERRCQEIAEYKPMSDEMLLETLRDELNKAYAVRDVFQDLVTNDYSLEIEIAHKNSILTVENLFFAVKRLEKKLQERHFNNILKNR